MRGSDTLKNVLLKVIVPCAILGAVGYIVSAAVKSRREMKQLRDRIELDLAEFEAPFE